MWLLALACTKPDDSNTETGTTDSAWVCDTSADRDCDGWPNDGDCEPDDPYSYPGADEVPYDGIDNDCDGDGDLVDFDGDGYDSDKVGGDDCNDGNPDIYPGAPEVCYDDIDQDCAGDEDTNDCDEDGYDGRGDDATDCADEDPDTNPGAEEIWYDGWDQDCSGYNDSDYDADGDGDDSADHPQDDGTVGTDCDDEDVLTAGGNPELWDGADRDCDGNFDNLSWADSFSAWSPKSGNNDGFIGMGGALLDDYDGDGFSEIAMAGFGATDDYTGRVYIISADETGTPGEMYHARIDGVVTFEYFGFDAENAGDLNGDGKDELLVGAVLGGSGDGAGVVFDGADLEAGGDLTSSDSLAQFTGNTYLGFEVASLSDMDGDGINELAAGTAWYLTTHVMVYSGADAAAGGSLKPIDAIAQIDGPSGADVGGHSVGRMDFDGDGLGDLLMGAYTSGAGVQVLGRGSDLDVGGSISTTDLPWIIGDSGDQVGLISGWMNDLDDDGYDELLIHAYSHQGAAPTTAGGRIYVVDGDDAPSGTDNASVADLADTWIDGTIDFGHVHSSESTIDIDGDGTLDLIVIESGDRNYANILLLEGNGPVKAQGSILYGDDLLAGGSLDADLHTDEVVMTGREDNDLTGYTTLVGDIDDDGLGDVVFGAPAASAWAGQVYTVLNQTDGVYE